MAYQARNSGDVESIQDAKSDAMFKELYDSIPPIGEFDTVADMVAYTGATIGQSVRVMNYSAMGQSGVLFFEAVALGTAVANTGSFINGTGVQWKQNFGPIMTLMQWGCSDGSGNDSVRANAALQYAALGAWLASNNQTKVYIGGRGVTFTSTVTIPAGITLQGNQGSPSGPVDNTINATTILLSTGASISMQVNSVLDGVEVLPQGVSFPSNAAAVATWAGTAIIGIYNDMTVRNCIIAGFEQAIKFGDTGTPSSRARIENVHIDCKKGLWLKGSGDVDRIHNVHCWPFASGPQFGVYADYVRPGPAIYLDNCGSWPKVTNCFEFAYSIGFRFLNSGGIVLSNCGNDGPTNIPGLNKRAILIETTGGPNSSIHIDFDTKLAW